MSEPAATGTHVRHDPGVPEPEVHLREFLALMRIGAGERGWATLRWAAHGFVYDVQVHRGVPVDVDAEIDDDARGAREALRRLLDRLNNDDPDVPGPGTF